MSTEISLTLSAASVILAVVFLVVLVITLRKSSNATTALKVFLAFLLIAVNIPQAIYGVYGAWLLVGLWTIVFTLNLATLAR